MLRSIGAPQAQDSSGMPSLTHVPGEPKTEILDSKDGGVGGGGGVYFGREKQIKNETRINVQGSGM